MDLYPEILDPEYDPKKKKQKVKSSLQILLYPFSSFRQHRKASVN
jgi:hypothetical protein